MKLNLNGWKKVNSEKDHSILQNKDGHQLKVLHKALSKDTRKQLDKLEMCEGGMAEGGDPTEAHLLPGDKNPNKIEKQVVAQAKSKMADGGYVPGDSGEKTYKSQPKAKDDVPEADPKKAKEVQKGATDSGWRPAEWKQNLKAGLGLAQGGMAHYATGSVDGPVGEDANAEAVPAYADENPQVAAAVPGMQKIASTWTDPAPAAENASPTPDQASEASPTPDQAAAAPAQVPPAGTEPMDPNSPAGQDPMAIQAEALKGIGKNESEGLKKEAELRQKAAQDLQTFQATKQAEDHKVFDEALAQGHDLANQKINPEQYWESHSRVLAAIGLALSSFGGTGEAAMNFLNNQINRSVEAQKHNLENKKNLLAMNMKIYGDKSAAEDVTRAAGAAAVAQQIQAAAAKSGSKEAELKAKLAVGQLMQQYQPLLQRAATIKTLNSGAAEKMDPADFIAQVAKPEHQKQIAEDMDAAKETRKSSKSIMEAFERAANDTTVLKTLGGIRTPGSAMSLHALISPSFKNIDNSVRKGAMDALFENITPAPGDSEAKTAEKRNTLAKWIQTKGASSLAKTNGIDFNKFEATKPLSTEELLSIRNSGGEDPALQKPVIQNRKGIPHQQVVINGKKGWVPVR